MAGETEVTHAVLTSVSGTAAKAPTTRHKVQATHERATNTMALIGNRCVF